MGEAGPARVVVLGGGGYMGRAVIRNLVIRDEIDEVVVADANEGAARALVDQLASPKLSVRRIDILDPEELRQGIRDATLVANLTPEFELGTTVARAVLDVGRNYVDIGADWRITEQLLALDAEVEAAGLTFLIGMGVSPGVTNLLARLGTERMEHATDIRIAWVAPAPPLLTPSGEWTEAGQGGTLQDFRRACTGNVPSFSEGRWVRLPSLMLGEHFDFPPPLGRCKLFHIGHLEPLTIPRFLPDVRTVSTYGGLHPPERNEEVRTKLRGAPDLGKSFSSRGAGESDDWKSMGGVMVVIEGEDAGRPVTLTYHYATEITSMAAQTSVPCAVASAWLCAGRVRRQGVVAAEACLDPRGFFEDLAEHYSRTLGSLVSFDQLVREHRDVH